MRKNGITTFLFLLAVLAWAAPLLPLKSIAGGGSYASISVHNYDGRAGAVIQVTYVRDGMTYHDTITTPTDLVVDVGSTVRLVAVPGPRMDFRSWSGHNIGACDGSTSPSCTFTVGSGGAFIASSFYYNLNLRIVDTNGRSLTGCTIHVRANPSGVSERDYGPGTLRVYVPTYQTIYLTPNPCPGYKFDHWVGDCSGSTCTLTNFRPAWSMDLPATVTAVYRGNRKLTVEVEGAGTTVPSPGIHYYGDGQVVRLVARAYAGYDFDHWVVDGVPASDQATMSVTMTEDHVIRAIFTPSAKKSAVVSLPVASPAFVNGTSCTSLPEGFPEGLRYRGAYADLVTNLDLLSRLAGLADAGQDEGVITIGRPEIIPFNWEAYGVEWKGQSVVVRGTEFTAISWEKDYAVLLVDCARMNLRLAGAGPLGSRIGLMWLLDRPETVVGKWILVIQWEDADGDGAIDPWELELVYWA